VSSHQKLKKKLCKQQLLFTLKVSEEQLLETSNCVISFIFYIHMRFLVTLML